MDLRNWLDANGGIRHVEEALAAGFTKHAIRSCIAAGGAERVRRRWLATRRAPAPLRRAAQIGGRVGCLSAARLHGLWTLDDGRLHLCVASNASRFDAAGDAIHWGAGPVAPRRFDLIDPVENALVDLASCRPLDHALVVWESALRKGLTSTEVLARLPMRAASAQRVRDGASQLSDSGIETIPVARLRRLGLEVRQQVLLDGHPVDALVEGRVVLQIDGFSFHSDPGRRRTDLAQDRRLALMGYTVFRYDYETVLYDWPRIEREVRLALAAR